MARPEGLEPPAYRFEACRSIQLSYGRTQCVHSIARPRKSDHRAWNREPAHRYARIAFLPRRDVARRSPVLPAGR